MIYLEEGCFLLNCKTIKTRNFGWWLMGLLFISGGGWLIKVDVSYSLHKRLKFNLAKGGLPEAGSVPVIIYKDNRSWSIGMNKESQTVANFLQFYSTLQKGKNSYHAILMWTMPDHVCKLISQVMMWQGYEYYQLHNTVQYIYNILFILT